MLHTAFLGAQDDHPADLILTLEDFERDMHVHLVTQFANATIAEDCEFNFFDDADCIMLLQVATNAAGVDGKLRFDWKVRLIDVVILYSGNEVASLSLPATTPLQDLAANQVNPDVALHTAFLGAQDDHPADLSLTLEDFERDMHFHLVSQYVNETIAVHCEFQFLHDSECVSVLQSAFNAHGGAITRLTFDWRTTIIHPAPSPWVNTTDDSTDTSTDDESEVFPQNITGVRYFLIDLTLDHNDTTTMNAPANFTLQYVIHDGLQNGDQQTQSEINSGDFAFFIQRPSGALQMANVTKAFGEFEREMHFDLVAQYVNQTTAEYCEFQFLDEDNACATALQGIFDAHGGVMRLAFEWRPKTMYPAPSPWTQGGPKLIDVVIMSLGTEVASLSLPASTPLQDLTANQANPDVVLLRS